MKRAFHFISTIGKISLTSPIVINVPTRAPLAVETKSILFLWLANLNNKSNVCKQISSLYNIRVRIVSDIRCLAFRFISDIVFSTKNELASIKNTVILFVWSSKILH